MSRRRRKEIKRNINFLVILSVVFLDQFTKYLIAKNLILGESIPVINNIFHITFVKNTGIAFGLFKGLNFIFIFLSIAAIIGIIFFLIFKENEKNYLKILSLNFILSGAIGNLIDRFLRGYIVDFIDFRIWPVFNLADSIITCGIILLIISLLLKHRSQYPN